MTDQTPRTEAGRRLLDDHSNAAVYCGRNDDLMTADILAIEAEARAEALDVEVLARAIHHAHKPDPIDIEGARQVATRYRAILAGETEHG
jgi:hypothetical protein